MDKIRKLLNALKADTYQQQGSLIWVYKNGEMVGTYDLNYLEYLEQTNQLIEYLEYESNRIGA